MNPEYKALIEKRIKALEQQIEFNEKYTKVLIEEVQTLINKF